MTYESVVITIDLEVGKLLQDARLDFLFVEGVAANIEYNQEIERYYSMLLQEVQDKKVTFDFLHYHRQDQGRTEIQYNMEMIEKKLFRKLKRLSQCQKRWIFDYYQETKVKDFKRTNLCEDKFCNNCKKVKQASRMGRYIPEIEKIEGKKIHLVLTQPNVNGLDLKDQISNILKAFTKLIEYLKGKKKIKGLDIDQWGYKAAVRSLEVTYKGDSYHPHLHVLLVFEEDFEIGEKTNKNAYSKKFGKVSRLFSDREIIIQKIWNLLLEDKGTKQKKVTKNLIDNLTIGYSCMMEEFKAGHYAELFKYITKADGSGKKENKNPEYFMSYENFKTLYFALDGVHQIQGYGELYHIQELPIDDTFESIYQALIEFLQEKEKPSRVSETPRAVQDNRGDYLYISRKKIHSFIKLYKVYQESETPTTVNIVEQQKLNLN